MSEKPTAVPESSESRPTLRERVRGRLDQLLYWTLCVAGIECSFEEIAKGSYSHRTPNWPPIRGLDDLDGEKYTVVDEYVASLEAETKSRYDRLDSKLRSLLSANAIAFGLIGGFSLLGKPIFLIVALPLLLSAVVALRALGVHKFQTVSLSKEEISVEADVLRATMIRDRVASANANSNVLDFIVDCLRAAHRFFILGLALVPVSYLIGLAFPAEPPQVRVLLDSPDAAHVQTAPSSTAPPPRSTVSTSVTQTVPQTPAGAPNTTGSVPHAGPAPAPSLPDAAQGSDGGP